MKNLNDLGSRILMISTYSFRPRTTTTSTTAAETSTTTRKPKRRPPFLRPVAKFPDIKIPKIPKKTTTTTEKPSSTSAESSTTKAFTVPEGGRTLAVENIFGSLFVTRRAEMNTRKAYDVVSHGVIHCLWLIHHFTKSTSFESIQVCW